MFVFCVFGGGMVKRVRGMLQAWLTSRLYLTAGLEALRTSNSYRNGRPSPLGSPCTHLLRCILVYVFQPMMAPATCVGRVDALT